MSRSPRKNLRRALQSLEEAFEVTEKHPAARAELVEALGAEGFADLEAVRRTLRAAVARLGDDAGGRLATEG